MKHLLCAGFQEPSEMGIISSGSEEKTEAQKGGGRCRVTQQPRGRAGMQARPVWLHIQCARYPHPSHMPGQPPSLSLSQTADP